jgi:hypothetical protein
MQRFLLLRAALVGVHAGANEGIGVERGGVVLRVELSLCYKLLSSCGVLSKRRNPVGQSKVDSDLTFGSMHEPFRSCSQYADSSRYLQHHIYDCIPYISAPCNTTVIRLLVFKPDQP